MRFLVRWILGDHPPQSVDGLPELLTLLVERTHLQKQREVQPLVAVAASPPPRPRSGPAAEAPPSTDLRPPGRPRLHGRGGPHSPPPRRLPRRPTRSPRGQVQALAPKAQVAGAVAAGTEGSRVRRATCSAWWRLLAAAPGSSSGQRRSIACSRWNRCPRGQGEQLDEVRRPSSGATHPPRCSGNSRPRREAHRAARCARSRAHHPASLWRAPPTGLRSLRAHLPLASSLPRAIRGNATIGTINSVNPCEAQERREPRPSVEAPAAHPSPQ